MESGIEFDDLDLDVKLALKIDGNPEVQSDISDSLSSVSSVMC